MPGAQQLRRGRSTCESRPLPGLCSAMLGPDSTPAATQRLPRRVALITASRALAAADSRHTLPQRSFPSAAAVYALPWAAPSMIPGKSRSWIFVPFTWMLPGMHVSVVNSYDAAVDSVPVSTDSSVDFPTEGKPISATRASPVFVTSNPSPACAPPPPGSSSCVRSFARRAFSWPTAREASATTLQGGWQTDLRSLPARARPQPRRAFRQQSTGWHALSARHIRTEERCGKAERVGRRKGFNHVSTRPLHLPTVFGRFVLLRLVYFILNVLDFLKKPHGGSLRRHSASKRAVDSQGRNLGYQHKERQLTVN